MRASFQLLRIILLVCMAWQVRAASDETWQSYRFAVMQTVLEVAVPNAMLDDLYKRDWKVPYRAPSLDLIYKGNASQVRLFNALLNINGSFWIGIYGRVDFFAFANRKPAW